MKNKINSITKAVLVAFVILAIPAAMFSESTAVDVTAAAKPAVKAKTVKLKKAVVKVEPTAVPTETATEAPASVTETAVPQTQTKTAGSLNFDDCFKLASEKNRDYKIAGLDKAAAEAQLSKAVASFGPTINVMGGYEPGAKLSTILVPAGTFGPAQSTDEYLSLMPLNYYSARVSLTQPLFTFGKTFFGFKMAEEAYKIAKINFKKASEKLNLDVINSFYGALIAQEMAKTMNETMKANEEYLRITKTKYQNGQASNFDVLQAQVQYANSIPDAQKAVDGARLSLLMLKNTIGIPLEQEITLIGTPEYKKLDMTYADIKKKYDEGSDDKAQVEAMTNIARYNRNLQDAMLLPNIALSANYNYVNTTQAFHHEASYWQPSWDITIGLQWTVFDSFKNVAAIKEANANSEKAELNKESMDNMLDIQLDQLYTSLEQNGKIIEAAGDLIKTAEEGYRIATESYKNGLIQSVDLLNAETGMLRAKMNYLSAMFNYITTAQKLKDYVN
jgi:outer membrane protein